MRADISEIVERINRCFLRHISEWDTSSLFVEPPLARLGWDVLDVDEVNRESRRGWQLADIQLLLANKIAVVLEIKCLDRTGLEGEYWKLIHAINVGLMELHDDWNYNHRLGRTCGSSVFVRGVLTNGQEWI